MTDEIRAAGLAARQGMGETSADSVAVRPMTDDEKLASLSQSWANQNFKRLQNETQFAVEAFAVSFEAGYRMGRDSGVSAGRAMGHADAGRIDSDRPVVVV